MPSLTDTQHSDADQYLAFNFSFITHEQKYSLDALMKRDRKFSQKLLKKVEALSTDRKVQVMNRNREQGFELMPFTEVRFRVDPKFHSMGFDEHLETGYWVFRLNKLGRVICGMINTVVYILAVDTDFETYKH
ncbi:hypothetical protein L248_2943 [Schleiferilactobacillus shenzhenensis LY-73]|uniref:Uncharacterized protein n=2 Tax=Schleiferilactobacillus shenzhenensis TaxID=1231337 RepID=U4TTP9_9LACO|nr:hypothetical protein L248_2943 [Schleiferilactobacillus shenzhenensis LY-73]